MTASDAKTFLLPPLLALLLYLLITHLLLPTYTHWRAHSTYRLLPSPSSPNQPLTLLTRLQSLLFRTTTSHHFAEEELLGDEELEEGLGVMEPRLQDRGHMVGAAGVGMGMGGEGGEGRRVSRELERDFMDSSDEEEGEGQRRVGRLR